MLLSFITVNAIFMLPLWFSSLHEALILNAGFCTLSSIFIATTSLHRRLTTTLLITQHDLDHAQAIGNTGNWRMNVQRNELIWSDENHRIFGIPKGTPLTYETFLAVVHPDDCDYVDRMWQAALRGKPYDIEHRIMVAGTVKWLRERAVLEFDKNGNLLGGFGTTLDITQLKRSEMELNESWQRYAGIVDSAMDAVITIDANQTIMVSGQSRLKMLENRI
jgi:PAS domain S-box-containing protein